MMQQFLYIDDTIYVKIQQTKKLQTYNRVVFIEMHKMLLTQSDVFTRTIVSGICLLLVKKGAVLYF